MRKSRLGPEALLFPTPSVLVGTMVGGALVAEVMFSYPGLGSTILTGVMGQDYPLISAVTLIISIMVLTATFVIEILYGIIDPRVKAAQTERQIINLSSAFVCFGGADALDLSYKTTKALLETDKIKTKYGAGALMRASTLDTGSKLRYDFNSFSG